MNLITAVILNWKRPQNLVNKILPTLELCPCIGEIIISHGNKNTIFNYKPKNHSKHVIHRDDHENNIKYGLSLRFISALDATYDTIIFIDDDIIPHPVTIINMLNIYNKNKPCIVSRFGRELGPNISYKTEPPIRQTLTNPIALTSCVIIPKFLCEQFFEYSNILNPFIYEKSRPLWNGEDIVISLLSIKLFNKWPIITFQENHFPIKQLKTKKDLNVAIHKMPGHREYRSQLIKKTIHFFKLHPNLLYNSKLFPKPNTKT